LPNLHHLALEAAVAAEAAGLQGNFWAMHTKIMDNQFHLNRASLNSFAEEIGLDMGEFISNFKNRHLLRKITSDFESGIHSGVIGTPAFFINGLMYNGFDDFNSLYKVCSLAANFCNVGDEPAARRRLRFNIYEQL
jgi:protein-disulfide isomerase